MNLKYPVCSDCHGHHDVEKPQVEFSLKTVCRECHLKFDQEMPALTEVVTENDRLWGTIRKVQDRNLKSDKAAVPEQFQQDLAAARHLTATLIHPAHKISAQQAEELNAQVKAARSRLEQWLTQDAAASKPAASKPSTPSPTDRSKNAP